MTEHNDFLDHFRQLNLRIRHQLDQADALIPQLNEQLKALTELNLAPTGLVLTGRVIHRQPYTENPWQLISERIYEAALITPEGIGITAWESEALLATKGEREPDFAEYRIRFQSYERLTPVLRGRLLRESIRLTEQLIELLGPAPF